MASVCVSFLCGWLVGMAREIEIQNEGKEILKRQLDRTKKYFVLLAVFGSATVFPLGKVCGAFTFRLP